MIDAMIMLDQLKTYKEDKIIDNQMILQGDKITIEHQVNSTIDMIITETMEMVKIEDKKVLGHKNSTQEDKKTKCP